MGGSAGAEAGFAVPDRRLAGFAAPDLGFAGFAVPDRGLTGFAVPDRGLTGFAVPDFGLAGFRVPAAGFAGRAGFAGLDDWGRPEGRGAVPSSSVVAMLTLSCGPRDPIAPVGRAPLAENPINRRCARIGHGSTTNTGAAGSRRTDSLTLNAARRRVRHLPDG